MTSLSTHHGLPLLFAAVGVEMRTLLPTSGSASAGSCLRVMRTSNAPRLPYVASAELLAAAPILFRRRATT